MYLYIETSFRSHMLQADSEQMCHVWIKTLQEGIGKAIQGINRKNSGLNLMNEDNAEEPMKDKKQSKQR